MILGSAAIGIHEHIRINLPKTWPTMKRALLISLAREQAKRTQPNSDDGSPGNEDFLQGVARTFRHQIDRALPAALAGRQESAEILKVVRKKVQARETFGKSQPTPSD